MKVAEYMTAAKEAQVAAPDTKLASIAKQLTENNVSCVVVVENIKPVGKKQLVVPSYLLNNEMIINITK